MSEEEMEVTIVNLSPDEYMGYMLKYYKLLLNGNYKKFFKIINDERKQNGSKNTKS